MEEVKRSFVVDATMENMEMVIGFVEEQLRLAGCPTKVEKQIWFFRKF